MYHQCVAPRATVVAPSLRQRNGEPRAGNARDNAKACRSGINDLDCIAVRRGPFIGQSSEFPEQNTGAMRSLVWAAEATSAINQTFKANTPYELNEMKNSPLDVANLVAADKMLTQALVDAGKALGDARDEIAPNRHVASFAADADAPCRRNVDRASVGAVVVEAYAEAGCNDAAVRIDRAGEGGRGVHQVRRGLIFHAGCIGWSGRGLQCAPNG